MQELGLLPLDVNQFYTRQGAAGQVRFIDKFLVPAAGRQAFLERVRINREFIKKLPGFVEDAAYERTDEQGSLVFITVAVWAHEQALQKAKEAVQAGYKQEGFNPAAFWEKLGISMDRGVYTIAGH
ncbi:antibiotic biosynthesis monooxygenase [Paraflavitalea speifideaquila]|uniref:antibiotic biosynthesis monooxygenase family protein n=1 Tax=Paraflavitalea speifideaquila TaxID=3076558 RepID=UPI0028EAA690|nr:antibiotic biosynthesis monooxygenase [Paraflavitalea speifideiaquila]